jgi:hypothetical protein
VAAFDGPLDRVPPDETRSADHEQIHAVTHMLSDEHGPVLEPAPSGGTLHVPHRMTAGSAQPCRAGRCAGAREAAITDDRTR